MYYQGYYYYYCYYCYYYYYDYYYSHLSDPKSHVKCSPENLKVTQPLQPLLFVADTNTKG